MRALLPTAAFLILLTTSAIAQTATCLHEGRAYSSGATTCMMRAQKARLMLCQSGGGWEEMKDGSSPVDCALPCAYGGGDYADGAQVLVAPRTVGAPAAIATCHNGAWR
jgi:hypothetical protein